MRIVVIDSDTNFASSFSQRCKKASVFCQVFSAGAQALAEIKKNPDAVDIVLIAKELAGGQDGTAIAAALRKDAQTADVPYVLMSTTWGKPEFAKHQKTEFGANAYYSKKSPLTELEATVEAVTGQKFAGAAAPAGGATQQTNGLGLNVQLQAASDVVNISEDVPNDISMSEPISLFPDDAAAAAAAPPPPAKAAAPAAPPAKAAAPAAPPAKAAAPAAPPAKAAAPAAPPSGGGIEISLGGDDAAPAIESKPVTPTPTVAAAETAGGGIEISLGGSDFQVETSKPKPAAAKPAAPAAPAPNMQVSAPATGGEVPQTDGGLFTIDLNAGNEEPAAAAPPAAAPKPAAPAAVAPAADAGGGLDIAFDMGAEAAPAAAPAPAAEAAAPAEAVVAAPAAELSLEAAPAEPAIDLAAAAPAELAAPPARPEASAPAVTIPAAVAAPEPVAPPVSEEEAAKDLPYLFAGPSAALSSAAPHSMPKPGLSSAHDIGGGSNEDVDTLKKYLTMREQDVSVLSAQLTYAKEELTKSEDTIKRLTFENEDLGHQINDLKRKMGEIESELQHAGKSREGEVEQLRFEVKSKIDRIKFLEDRLSDSAVQYEKLKERVRLDIRKIRVREKELESKLEILKKDSETLIAGREAKILELKRKIDLLEFNYDTLQDKNDMEKQNVVKANEKIERVLKVIKLAMGVIEAEGEDAGKSEDAGGAGAKVA